MTKLLSEEEKPKRVTVNGKYVPVPVMDRFFDKIESMDDCWIWTGSKNEEGYGLIGVNNRTERAHAISYKFFVGEVPKGLELDHLCENKSCVNPDHLEAVPHSENVRRGWVKRLPEYCEKAHHKLTPDNIIVKKSKGLSYRTCKQCYLDYERGRQALNKAERAELEMYRREHANCEEQQRLAVEEALLSYMEVATPENWYGVLKERLAQLQPKPEAGDGQ